ncbi:MAG: tetratricopeptide repeat protein [Alphaproteobacteria bacterium]
MPRGTARELLHGLGREPSARRPLPPCRRPHLAGVAILVGLALAVALPLGPGAALAQMNPPAGAAKGDLQTQYDALFQQLLKDPTNIDLTFRFAHVATRLGNYESAVSALERLLLYDPNFPDVKLELAELYYHMGSYEMAKTYLDQAKKQEPNPSPQVAQREQTLADEIAGGGAPSKWTASALVGARYQTNANASPAGAQIIVGGVPATLSSVFVRKADWNLFFDGNAQNNYDLGPKTKAAIETNVLVYYSKQIDLGTLDSAAVEVNSGPRFDVGDEDTTFFNTRPYLLGNEVLLGNAHYFWTVGAGLEVNRPITDQLRATGDYELRSQHFSNNATVPGATGLSGLVHSFSLDLAYQLIENGSLGFETSYSLDDANLNFDSSRALEFRLSYAQTIPLSWKFPQGPLVITPELYRIYTDYDAANPTVLPLVTQVTREWRYGATAQLGLTGNVAASLHLVHEYIASNIVAAKYTNTEVIMGLLLTY